MLLQQSHGRGHVSRRLLLQEAILDRAGPALQLLGLLLEALQPAGLLQEVLSVGRLALQLDHNKQEKHKKERRDDF